MDASYLEHCKNVLRTNGYVVIARERHKVLTCNYVVPDYERRSLRSGDDRWSDIALSVALQKLGRAAFDEGCMIHMRQDLDDPVTGREIIFTSAIGLIKPKAADEC